MNIVRGGEIRSLEFFLGPRGASSVRSKTCRSMPKQRKEFRRPRPLLTVCSYRERRRKPSASWSSMSRVYSRDKIITKNLISLFKIIITWW